MTKLLNAKTSLSVAVAACAGELPAAAPSEIMLIPAGSFRARDGRPKDSGRWQLNAEAAARIIAQADSGAGDFVIDYEHQTLHAEDNGQPAPAAGWFKKMDWRPGDGLYATDVRWTAKARALIEAGEYRYISPVFEYDKKSGVVSAVLMAALTNYPALDGHSDLAARAAAKFHIIHITKEDEKVDRKQLIALLGLEAAATDEQIEQGLTALKAKAGAADGKDAKIAALKTANDAEIMALKAKGGGKPDPAKYVPVTAFEALKTEVAALKSEQTSNTVADLVKQGIADGRLLPVQEEWATELGNSDTAALKSYLAKTPAIAALTGSQSKGKEPEKGPDGLTADELAVCRNFGISAEEYKKSQAA